MKTLFKNVNIFTLDGPHFRGWLLTDGKKILDFGKGECEIAADETIDGKGANLLPGLIDIHTHGCLGCCTTDASEEGLIKMGRRHACHGVTSWLPTSMTGPQEQILAAAQTVAGMIGKRGDYSKILGIHLEGPFLNAAKCGAQDTSFIRPATEAESRVYLETGAVRRITFAPEIPENMQCADLFRDAGVTITAGHTNANYDILKAAIPHGFTGITHLFNGMGAFSHRDPGTIGGALTLPEYVCELICDNIHSHPVAHKLAWEAKGRYGITLITDGIRPAGLPDGVYTGATGEQLFVTHNGTELRIANGALAGSALTLNIGLKNFIENVGASLDETWPCSSYNAACVLGIDDETGSIGKGKLADLVLLDESYETMLTMIEGQIVYRQA